MPPSVTYDIYIDDVVYTNIDSAVTYTTAQLYAILSRYNPSKPGKTFLGLVDPNGNPIANDSSDIVYNRYYTTWEYHNVWIEGQVLRDIAEAIRAKAGLNQSTIIKVDDMATLIANL